MAVFVLWLLLAIWRIVWSLLPQPGYIHPDEFFQSPEVLAGDVLNLQVLRTWEFSSDRPVRSITFPYLTAGLPFRLLKYVADNYAGSAYINDYTLIVFPRVAMVVLSFLNDWFLYKICKTRGLPATGVVMSFATSYIATMYSSRTLSNTLELLFFTALLYFVLANRGRKYIETVRHHSQSVDRDGNVATATRIENIEHYKSSAFLSACVPVIIVAGIFNRPTFAFYAIVPIVVWLFENGGLSSTVRRVVSFITVGGVTAIVLIVIDSYYYKYNTIHVLIFEGLFAKKSLDSLFELMNALVVTPVNFAVYNANAENLARHGLHPRFLHLLVNVPLICGPGVVLLAAGLARFVRGLLARRCTKIETVFMLSLVVPLGLFSLFPHQEPRFIIPLIAPILLLIGHRLFAKFPRNIAGATWIIFNLMAFVVYGLFHQAGLYPCLSYLQNYLHRQAATDTNYHIIFYHTYMPPRHLLTINKFDGVGYIPRGMSESEAKKAYRQNVTVHDLGGAEFVNLEHKINDIIDDHKATTRAIKTEILIVLPATLEKQLCEDRKDGLYQIVGSFGPHISFEDPPAWKDEFRASSSTWCRRYCLHKSECAAMTAADRWSHVLSLQLYKITLEDKLAPPVKKESPKGR